MIYNLKVNIKSCKLSLQDSIVEISGSIEGGWPKGVLPRLKNNSKAIEQYEMQELIKII